VSTIRVNLKEQKNDWQKNRCEERPRFHRHFSVRHFSAFEIFDATANRRLTLKVAFFNRP
jgi:hypothetical protein